MRILNDIIELLESRDINFTVGNIHDEEIIIRILITEAELEQLQYNDWAKKNE